MSFVFLIAPSGFCGTRRRDLNLNWEQRAEIAYQRKRYDKAIALYQEAIREGRTTPWVLYRLSEHAVEQGDWKGGVRYGQAALELDPANALVYVDLGWALIETGRVKEAITCLTRGIELNPRLAPAYNNLGYAYLKEQAYDRAIAAFRAAIDLEPGDLRPYWNLTDAYVALRRFDEAVGTCQRLLSHGAQEAPVLYALALVHERAGDTDRALATYHEVLTRHPAERLRISASLGLARMYHVQHKTREMMAALENAGLASAGPFFAATILSASLIIAIFLVPVAAVLWIVMAMGRRMRRARTALPDRHGIPPWGLRDVGLVLGVWPVSSTAVTLIAGWLWHSRSPLAFFMMPVDQLSALALMQGLSELLPCAVVAWLVFGKYRQGCGALGLAHRWAGQALGWALAAVGVIVFVDTAYTLLYSVLSGHKLPPQSVSQFIVISRTGFDKVVLIGVVVLLAPIFEECVFRGFVYPAIRKRVGVVYGAIFSALLFSFFHLSLAYAVPFFISGVILAFVYEKTKSLHMAIATHLAMNGLAMVGALYRGTP